MIPSISTIVKLTIQKAKCADITSILNLLYELERPKPVNKSSIELFKNKINEYFFDSQKTIIVSE